MFCLGVRTLRRICTRAHTFSDFFGTLFTDSERFFRVKSYTVIILTRSNIQVPISCKRARSRSIFWEPTASDSCFCSRNTLIEFIGTRTHCFFNHCFRTSANLKRLFVVFSKFFFCWIVTWSDWVSLFFESKRAWPFLFGDNCSLRTIFSRRSLQFVVARADRRLNYLFFGCSRKSYFFCVRTKVFMAVILTRAPWRRLCQREGLRAAWGTVFYNGCRGSISCHFVLIGVIVTFIFDNFFGTRLSKRVACYTLAEFVTLFILASLWDIYLGLINDFASCRSNSINGGSRRFVTCLLKNSFRWNIIVSIINYHLISARLAPRVPNDFFAKIFSIIVGTRTQIPRCCRSALVNIWTLNTAHESRSSPRSRQALRLIDLIVTRTKFVILLQLISLALLTFLLNFFCLSSLCLRLAELLLCSGLFDTCGSLNHSLWPNLWQWFLHNFRPSIFFFKEKACHLAHHSIIINRVHRACRGCCLRPSLSFRRESTYCFRWCKIHSLGLLPELRGVFERVDLIEFECVEASSALIFNILVTDALVLGGVCSRELHRWGCYVLVTMRLNWAVLLHMDVWYVRVAMLINWAALLLMDGWHVPVSMRLSWAVLLYMDGWHVLLAMLLNWAALLHIALEVLLHILNQVIIVVKVKITVFSIAIV